VTQVTKGTLRDAIPIVQISGMAGRRTQSHRDLLVWQRAIDLCVAIYAATEEFHRTEIYGLTNQLRRASASIPSNIAEGYGRLTKEQYRHFLGIAQGFNLELQTQLTIAERLGFGDFAVIGSATDLSNEVGKMLKATIARL
jgi:four helix bundle protein